MCSRQYPRVWGNRYEHETLKIPALLELRAYWRWLGDTYIKQNKHVNGYVIVQSVQYYG